ncbi:hypothetical protein GCM10008919_06090 [Selenomonas dianae]|uniref:Uncharacterized protein n=1 Tax=Selenomonas dianae TaxID=135079 RepID=A0ABN0SXV3_9FIRM
MLYSKANPSGASGKRARSAPCGFLSFKRSAFKKSAGILADKCPTVCVTKRLRGVHIPEKFVTFEKGESVEHE